MRTGEFMDKKKWFGLFFISLGVATIIVDSTIVNVSVPSIIEDLKITSTEAQWVQEAYTLIFASTLLVFGRLSDKFGRRAMFSLGVVIFVASSLIAASAPTGTFLIAARLVQGLGGAMMLPTSLSILNSTFFGKERGIAFAVWGSTIGGAAALGPLLGGWLTTDYSWRWAFGINLPLGLIVLVGTWLFVKESKGSNESGADYLGALFSVLAMGTLVYALIEGRNFGWWNSIEHDGLSIIPFIFAASAILFVAFARLQISRNRDGKAVLFDLSLLAIPSFRNANIAAAIVSLGEFGLLFSLPLWLQNVLGYSAFDTGKIFLFLAIGSFLASGAGAQLMTRIGAVNVVRTGIVLELLGILAVALVISPTTSAVVVSAALFVYGMGVGLATAQLTGVVLAEVPVERSGQASGMASTMRQLGSALGIAILGTTLFSSFSSGLDPIAEQSPATADALVSTAGALIPTLDAAWQKIASEAFSSASAMSAFVACGFLVIGLLATMRLKSVPVGASE
jgi:EmrB/QacA subfamily drug resistance transporter